MFPISKEKNKFYEIGCWNRFLRGVELFHVLKLIICLKSLG